VPALMVTFLSSLRGWTRIDLFELCHYIYIYIYTPKSQLRLVSESLASLAQLECDVLEHASHVALIQMSRSLIYMYWGGKDIWHTFYLK